MRLELATKLSFSRLIGYGDWARRRTLAGTIKTYVRTPTTDRGIFRGIDFISVAVRASAGAGIRLADLGRGGGRTEIVRGPLDAAGDDELGGIYSWLQHGVYHAGSDLDRDRANRRTIQAHAGHRGGCRHYFVWAAPDRHSEDQGALFRY